MLQKLLAAGDGGLPSEEDIEEIFWQSDKDVGKMLASLDPPLVGHGCTAQILLAKTDANGGIECIQAWAGDSTAVRVDMKTGQVVDATLNHTPGEGNESELLMHMAAVSKACQKRDKKAFKAIAHAIREDGHYVEAGENDNLIVQKLQANPNPSSATPMRGSLAALKTG